MKSAGKVLPPILALVVAGCAKMPQAADAAVRGAEQAASEVARMLPEIEKSLADAGAAIGRAAAARQPDVRQLEAQLEAARQSLEEAKKDQTARRFVDSRNKLRAISDALAAAAGAIDEATKARR